MEGGSGIRVNEREDKGWRQMLEQWKNAPLLTEMKEGAMSQGV